MAVKRIDFSQWHPSDHIWFSKRCRSLYMGGMWHIRHWRQVEWRFHYRDSVLGWFARKSTCLVGRHSWRVWWKVDRDENGKQYHAGAGAMCGFFCGARRETTEAEKANPPPLFTIDENTKIVGIDDDTTHH